jgi:tyrosine-protein phosphatase YwqE
MERVFAEKIDAYIADLNFRKIEPRFASAERYKELERRRTSIRPVKDINTTTLIATITVRKNFGIYKLSASKN